jgi:hypothetical protein
MRAWKELSPMQLGRRIGLGATLFVCSSLVLLFFPDWRTTTRPLQDASGFLVFLEFCGVAIWWTAESRLEGGIRTGKWKEVELELLQKRADHPVLNMIVWLPLLCWLIYILTPFTYGHRAGRFAYFSLPVIMLWRLQRYLTPRPEVQLAEPQAHKPLQSKHWGEPR